MKELDVVRLVQELQSIPVGTEGTIVHKYDDSMYEVEFFNKDGDTLDVVTTPKRDRKSTRLNSSHRCTSRMPSSA